MNLNNPIQVEGQQEPVHLVTDSVCKAASRLAVYISDDGNEDNDLEVFLLEDENNDPSGHILHDVAIVDGSEDQFWEKVRKIRNQAKLNKGPWSVIFIGELDGDYELSVRHEDARIAFDMMGEPNVNKQVLFASRDGYIDIGGEFGLPKDHAFAAARHLADALNTAEEYKDGQDS